MHEKGNENRLNLVEKYPGVDTAETGGRTVQTSCGEVHGKRISSDVLVSVSAAGTRVSSPGGRQKGEQRRNVLQKSKSPHTIPVVVDNFENVDAR